MKFGAFLVAAAAAQYAGDGTVSITRDTIKKFIKNTKTINIAILKPLSVRRQRKL